MNSPFQLLIPAAMLSLLCFANCGGNTSKDCNEADAMYTQDAYDDPANKYQEVKSESNTDLKRRNRMRSYSGRYENSLKAGVNSNEQTKGDPENGGNKDGNNSTGNNSEGQNIGNKNTSATNPSKGGTGSASSPGSRGNSGEGRPY